MDLRSVGGLAGLPDFEAHEVCRKQASRFEVSQPAVTTPRSRLRPAGSALPFVPFYDWEPNRSYEGEPTI
ncbi:hypothetical protein FOFC_20642 [Fusarium oxysporum]|nr:hypothetical protein FOFC_20642 [Fusarium oxysporum]